LESLDIVFLIEVNLVACVFLRPIGCFGIGMVLSLVFVFI